MCSSNSSVLRRWTLRAVHPPTWPSTGRVRRLSPSITPTPCPGSSRVLDPSSTCPIRVKNRSKQSMRFQTTKQKWVSLKFKFLNPINFCNVQVFPLYATFILLEWLILWLKGKSLPNVGESAATVTLAICFLTVRYYMNAALVWLLTYGATWLQSTQLSFGLKQLKFFWSRLLCKGTLHSTYLYIYENYRIVDLPWDSPVTWYFTAIFLDLCFYWSHRAGHGEVFICLIQHQKFLIKILR